MGYACSWWLVAAAPALVAPQQHLTSRLPHFIAPAQNEVKFSNFAEFKKVYFMPFLVTFQKLAVEKGVCKDDAEMKGKGKRMAGALMKWIKANFDELQFYSLETYVQDGADTDDKYKDLQIACNLAYVRQEADPCPLRGCAGVRRELGCSLRGSVQSASAVLGRPSRACAPNALGAATPSAGTSTALCRCAPVAHSGTAPGALPSTSTRSCP